MSEIRVEQFSDDETNRLIQVYESFSKNGQKYVRTNPGNCVLPIAYEKYKDRYKNWQVRSDDIYVLGFPRSGTNWTQELIWLIQNDCDVEAAKRMPLDERFPCFESDIMVDFCREILPSFKPQEYLQSCEDMPPPRMLKSHLQFRMLPDDLLDRCKVVLCLRNPKDVMVSWYHYEKMVTLHRYVGDFRTYFELFMDNLVVITSYFDYVTQAWERRQHPNLHVVFYEDMKKDQVVNMKKVARFFGKELKNEQVSLLVDHLSFEKMKNNNAVNSEIHRNWLFCDDKEAFIRKGEIGDWRNYFTEDMNRIMDDAINKYLDPIDLKFQYE